MDFLKSDLNHNTRKYDFVKNGEGRKETAGLPTTPTVIFSQAVFSDPLACQARMAPIQCKYYIFNIWMAF